jgi:segregation and condensation protein B
MSRERSETATRTAEAAAPESVRPLVEALLFASSKPVPPERLAEAAETPVEEVEAALMEIEKACEVAGRGVRLDRVAGGVRLVSRSEFDVPIRRLLGMDGKNKLSIASLETLAIIAYRQPVTAPEIAELRGVNSSSSIHTLLDRRLITTAGRREVVGTPFLYKTTKEFLVHFGLNELSGLPKPEELEALYGVESNTMQTELFPEETRETTAEETGESGETGEEHHS